MLKQFDVFGEAAALNYKGSATFKTQIGALFSILLRCFIFFYASVQLVGLLQYKDQQILTVSYLYTRFF